MSRTETKKKKKTVDPIRNDQKKCSKIHHLEDNASPANHVLCLTELLLCFVCLVSARGHCTLWSIYQKRHLKKGNRNRGCNMARTEISLTGYLRSCCHHVPADIQAVWIWEPFKHLHRQNVCSCHRLHPSRGVTKEKGERCTACWITSWAEWA